MRSALSDEAGKTSRTTITIPESDHALLIRLAEHKHVSLAWVIRDAIRTYLDSRRLSFPHRPTRAVWAINDPRGA